MTVNIIVGHYGVGKTTYALNVALQSAALGESVALADLDVVNPYFRSTEYRALLEAAGVRVIAPRFSESGTSVDAPGLTGAITPAIEQAARNALTLYIDAGGDDVGATALGRFAKTIEQAPYNMYYVVNRFRSLTQTPEEALSILVGIEQKSHLKATALVDNSHLKDETDEGVIKEGITFAQAVSKLANLPLAIVTVPAMLFEAHPNFKHEVQAQVGEDVSVLPITPYVATPWGT